MKSKYIASLTVRYIILLLLALFISLFYFILTPLTVLPVFSFLSLLFGASLLPGNVISFSGISIRIIPACVAGAAYFLLVSLNLSSPMAFKTRLRSLAFLVFAFLMLNILRIMTFSLLAAKGFSYFSITHKIIWYFGSTALIVLIWFSNVKIFNIRSIPFHTDFNTLKRSIKHG